MNLPLQLRHDRYYRVLQASSILALLTIAFTLAAHEDPVVPPPASITSAVELTAMSAYMLDIGTGEVLFSKNPDSQLPIASITKLFTVAAVSEVLSEESIVRVSREAVVRGEGGLGEGEEWRMRELADYTLVVSSNVGAEALAEAADPHFALYRYSETPTVERMNTLAKELGLSQTYFLNATGLDISTTQASAFSSARDVAHFLAYLHARSDLYDETTHTAREFRPLNADTLYGENTNDALPDIPGLIFGKTGFTDLAGGTLAILFEMGPARPVAIVVLGSTREARFDDIRTLIGLANSTAAR